MLRTVLVSTLFGATLWAGPAGAASATPEEADRLKALFERYVGSPQPGQAGGVTVSPEGSDYRASFDLKALTRPLQIFGMTFEPATAAFVLTPNENGTWRVRSDAFPPVVLHLSDQTLSLRSDAYRFTGTFNPKIPAFSEASTTQDGTTFDQDAPKLTQHRRIGHAASTQTASPGENGSATIGAHYDFSDMNNTVEMRAPVPPATVEVAPTPPPTAFSYTMPVATADLSIDKLRLRNVLDIWAFLVAHPNRDAIAASQEDLRGLLRSALPLFGALKQSGSVEGLSVTSQLGPFSARKVLGSLDLSDVAGAGKAVFGLTVDGLTIPSTDLPPWSVGLIPTAIDLEPTLTGFHLQDAAKQAVEDFDLRQNGFTPAQREKIAHLVWPGEGGRLVLAPSRITSGLLDLRFDADVALGAVPTGRVSVTATGLDKAIDVLQGAAGTDASAAQLLVQFVTAKNLAKPSPDGSYTWMIEAAGPGPVTVNGATLQ